MGMPVAKFEIVEEGSAPAKANRPMSAEDVEVRNAYIGMLQGMKVGQVAKLNLADVGGDNPARSLGIVLGHIIKDIGLAGQFETWNNEGFYCVKRIPASKSNGNVAKEAVPA